MLPLRPAENKQARCRRARPLLRATRQNVRKPGDAATRQTKHPQIGPGDRAAEA
jgi:hypothetical protein